MSNQSDQRPESEAKRQPKNGQGEAARTEERESMDELNARFEELTIQHHKEYEEYLRRKRKTTFRYD